MNASQEVLTMIIASIVIGYITMPIILGFSPYVTLNANKFYGALLMGFLMGIVQLYMVWDMFDYNTAVGILGGLVILSMGMIYIIIQQMGITQNQYLEGMIEHHAMAIQMSKKILLKANVDEEMKQLAKNIITNQHEEINQMEQLIHNV
jgi:hypothetical protein